MTSRSPLVIGPLAAVLVLSAALALPAAPAPFAKPTTRPAPPPVIPGVWEWKYQQFVWLVKLHPGRGDGGDYEASLLPELTIRYEGTWRLERPDSVAVIVIRERRAGSAGDYFEFRMDRKGPCDFGERTMHLSRQSQSRR